MIVCRATGKCFGTSSFCVSRVASGRLGDECTSFVGSLISKGKIRDMMHVVLSQVFSCHPIPHADLSLYVTQ